MISNKKQFFILGNPRSGTTLFRLMLNSHPDIIVPPECGFAEWFINDFSDVILNKKTYRTFAEAVCKCRKFETWGVSYDDLIKVIYYYSPKSYMDLCTCVYLSYANKFNKKPLLIGDKNNYYINKVERLSVFFPSSKKIFIIRDGRDVASSYFKLAKISRESRYFPELSDSISEIAYQWLKSANSALKYKSKGAIIIRYEDLIANPEVVLNDVCCYLNISYSPIMLKYYESNDEPVEFLAWKEKTQRAIMPENKGGYLTELTRHQIREFEVVAGPALKIFGYN
ncbi:sulfotransferase [Oceanisphaera pacifica]|uniref:Sulfotransferase n=1 Tax=Oceanisphaera pacifica TaxID=2818389 RepID=A0ABS3NJN6_9GAMM|nr:sulfotransferase [Oceanisphaera pacifica]